jgi:hypothetical protein
MSSVTSTIRDHGLFWGAFVGFFWFFTILACKPPQLGGGVGGEKGEGGEMFPNTETCRRYAENLNPLGCGPVLLDPDQACPSPDIEFIGAAEDYYGCLAEESRCVQGILDASRFARCVDLFVPPAGSALGPGCVLDLMCPRTVAVGEETFVGPSLDEIRALLDRCRAGRVMRVMAEMFSAHRWTLVAQGGEAAFLDPDTGEAVSSLRGAEPPVFLVGLRPGPVLVFFAIGDGRPISGCPIIVVGEADPCGGLEPGQCIPGVCDCPEGFTCEKGACVRQDPCAALEPGQCIPEVCDCPAGFACFEGFCQPLGDS